MYDEGRYLDDERAGMREGDHMPQYDKPSATWIVSPWLGPLAERIGRDIAYCVIECGMTRDEAARLCTLLPHFLTIAATQEPASLIQTMAKTLYDEMTARR